MQSATSGAASTPQQVPAAPSKQALAGPQQQAGGTFPGGSLFADTFAASVPGAPQRNPTVTPEGGNL